MTSLPAKVTPIEKLSDQYGVIVPVNNKYRGSFNTLAFGEVKPYSCDPVHRAISSRHTVGFKGV
jgi:hypothetical protein